MTSGDQERRGIAADVAVLDPLALFRLGLVAALGRGTNLESDEDLQLWRSTRGGILLLTVIEDDDTALPTGTGGGLPIDVVAVLEPFTVTHAARALRAGAVNVVARDASPDEFRRVVAETRAGRLTVPYAVLRAATAGPRGSRATATPSDEELSWLAALAGGASVAALARTARFSERMMYRKLRALYRRLGVAGRTQALILARDEGWL